MNSLKISSGARLRALATAAALTFAAFAIPASACPSEELQIEDAFAVAEDADLSYLPFTLGEAQDEYATMTDRVAPDASVTASDEPIVMAGSFEFD